MGELGSIPWLRRSFGGGNGNPLQCFCLENPMDRRVWLAKYLIKCKNDNLEFVPRGPDGADQWGRMTVDSRAGRWISCLIFLNFLLFPHQKI